ncbi:alpha/beta hydrolase [Ensifer soli]|uniref:alpha/beta hydrolase n=1 Tax=Ciceribacter sp. sgz301302 TaxID=3342379 RepID=UPI0035BA4174
MAVAILLAAAVWAPPARADGLKPFKDDLFAYRVIESADGGDFQRVDYDEMRDINGRDQIPERRVKRAYVDLGVKKVQADEVIEIGGRGLPVTRVGRAEGAAFTVIFIHGRGGDRRLGANDYSFGGNFNRLKNLAAGNGGAYYAPSVPSFDAAGVTAVAALIGEAARRSPGRPVVLACASMGSFVCWGIARDPEATALLAGMIVMGGASDATFARTAAGKRRLPLYLSHGSRDSVYAADSQADLYAGLHRQGYPVRFVLFESGSHGTPVRMTDWRDALNWILR